MSSISKSGDLNSLMAKRHKPQLLEKLKELSARGCVILDFAFAVVQLEPTGPSESLSLNAISFNAAERARRMGSGMKL